MKLVVFGAAGRTGRRVVEQGLERGHEIVAFVHDASRSDMSSGELLEVAEGDARDPDAVGRALRGADGAISVIALMSAEREPEHSEVTRTIVDAAGREGVRRIVVAANHRVFDDDEVTGEFAAQAREHRRNRETLKASTLDWTVLAAPSVVDDPGTGSYQVALDERAPGRKIPTQDFARAALDALEHDEWIGRLVGVASTTSAA